MTVQIDGSDPSTLAARIRNTGDSPGKYWSSSRRQITSEVDEILEIGFGSNPRMVNLITFDISRFPLTLRVEYADEEGDWVPFEHAHTLGVPATLTIAESVPAVVDRAFSSGHPQHYGGDHWRSVDWSLRPVYTSRIRFIARRIPTATGPVTPQGHPTDYSIALRLVKFGYRVQDLADIPLDARRRDTFETATDILGSSVRFSIYEQGPEKAVDGDPNTYWRSEPQPINYAVVPLYLDMRDVDGNGQVIDRFYVDPLTAGVHCNLYFSNDEPTGDFVGGQSPVPSSLITEVNGPVYGSDTIRLGAEVDSGVRISPVFLRIQPGDSWWVGLDAVARDDLTSTDRPIFAMGGNKVYFDGAEIVFEGSDGTTQARVAVAPEHVEGIEYRVVLAYYADPVGRAPYFALHYAAPTYFYETSAEVAYTVTSAEALSIGLYDEDFEPVGSVTSRLDVKGLVVKPEALDEQSLTWFVEDGSDYVADDQTFPDASNGTNVNAILRMHPIFTSPENSFGVVGGDTQRMENIVWRPISRDYILRRGYMEFPPIRARYWKFEFTQLSPRIYETFQIVDREVLCFPAYIVDRYNQVGPQQSRTYLPHGVQTIASGEAVSHDYIDALQGLRYVGGGDQDRNASSALVVTDPNRADKVASLGWIWQYQPWHAGAASPRWSEPGMHYYERISLRHRSRVAYYVGIKELVPSLTNYVIADDNPEYVEHFLSDAMIEDSDGVTLHEDGMVSDSSYGVFTSVSFASYQSIRGVQFATVQTPPTQVLPDPEFVDEDLYLNYIGYGDVIPERGVLGDVRIKRAYSTTDFQDIEDLLYGEDPSDPLIDNQTHHGGYLDEYTYGELEGRTLSDGNAPDYSEGGIATVGTYAPMGSGEIIARAKVSAVSPSSEPIRLEVVNGPNGIGTVVAAAQKSVPVGGPVDLEVVFTPEDIINREPRTYGDIEDLYVPPAAYVPPLDPYAPWESGPGAASPGTTVTTTAGEYYLVGPGSLLFDSPRYLPVHGYSINEDIPSGDYRWYQIVPSRDGWLTVDTYLSERSDGGVWDHGGGYNGIGLSSGYWDDVHITPPDHNQKKRVRVRSGVPFKFFTLHNVPHDLDVHIRVSPLFDTEADATTAPEWDISDVIVISSTSTRKAIEPHRLSTEAGVNSGDWRYYVINPISSGLISIDTFLTEASDGDPGPGANSTEIEIESTHPDVTNLVENVLDPDTAETVARARAIVGATPGQEIRFRARALGETFDLRVRTSEVGNPIVWTPPLPPEEVPIFDVGTGSYSASAPTLARPLTIGTSSYSFIEGSWVYYGFIPTESGEISVDTYLSAPSVGSPPSGFEVQIEALSGVDITNTYVLSGKQRFIGTVAAGDEILVRARALDVDGPVFAIDSTIKVRFSAIGDTTLWDPDDYDAPVDSTYGFLEGYTYGELEIAEYAIDVSALSVRLRQQGSTDDEFVIHSIELFDDPVAWSFTVNGTDWYRAPGVRNRTSGALMLPATGNEFRWRAEMFMEGASITALYVRPMYGSRSHSADPTHDLEALGPNESGWDNLPSLKRHPIWMLGIQTIGAADRRPPLPSVWRNLIGNPSGESSGIDQWEATGGVIVGGVTTGDTVVDEGDVV